MNQSDTITVRNWAIAITIGIALVVLFIILSLLKNYLWPQVYEAPEFRYERIKPIGQVHVGPITTVATQTTTAPKSGKEVYETVCTACHSTGTLNAPKYGDKPSWEPRIAKGENVLIENALKGFNLMPARGGQTTLSDEEIKATVQYMLAAVSASPSTEATSSGATDESSSAPKPEPTATTPATDSNAGATASEATSEPSPPPQPESGETPNATDKSSSLSNSSSLVRSSIQ